MNSRWSDPRRTSRRSTLLLIGLLAACGRENPKPTGSEAAAPPADPAQADAESLGRELYDMVDRVMAYRSAHRNKLPASLRQAGLDSLTPVFVRRLGRQGDEPLVTIAFRRPAGHVLRSCAGTSMVLENSMLRDGAFDIQCELVAGGSRPFLVGGSQ